MKILVITPFRKGKYLESIVSNIENYEVVNTAPLQMCTLLGSLGHDVIFISLQNVFRSFNPKEDTEKLNTIIKSIEFDILIFHTDYYMNNSNTASLFSMKIISAYVKSTMKEKKIIYCGKLTEMLEEKLFTLLPDIDIAIRGEAEPVINQILWVGEDQLLNIGIGLIARIDGCVCSSDGISIIKNYNNLPIINYNFLDYTISLIESYVRKVDFLPISIRTSYGCPYQCMFCKNTKDWNNYRTKSKDVIDKELQNVQTACGGKLKIVFLADEIFTVDNNHVVDICDAFEKHHIMINGLFSHANQLTYDTILQIKRISRSVLVGAETSNQGLLNLTGKKMNFSDLIERVKLARKHGLAVGLEWIIGLPNSTLEDALFDLNKIYMLIAKNQVDFIEPYVFTPHPNTAFYNNAERFGLVINHNYDEMLEEGGFPQITYVHGLSSRQLFVVYLLTKIVISEAEKAKGHVSTSMLEGCVNIDDFKKICEVFKH